MQEERRLAGVEQTILPHLDAAYNLARWLTASEQDAEDVVQEACLRAIKFFPAYQGGNARAWLLTIVRRTCWTWLTKNRNRYANMASFDEELHSGDSDALDPQLHLLRQADRHLIREALEALPVEYREVVVLRELEGMTYREVATVAEIPLGTVMSRLARGRKQLQQFLATRLGEESKRGM